MAEFNEPKMQDVEDESEEFELGHTDKLVGVFSSPSATFGKISNFPPKVIDWFLPIFLVTIIAVFAQFVKMSNPTINYEITQKQIDAQSKALDERVSRQEMTREQADQQLETTSSFINSPIMKIIGVVVGLIGGFIVFFIMAGIYHLFARFALHGSGTYGYTLVSYGLAFYILALQHILSTILSLVTSKFVSDFSVASIAGMDKMKIFGFILSFVDPISIWFYFVFAVALAKTFKSDNTKKYVITVFAVWVGISVIFYVLAQAVPFFSSFINK